ncbi:ribonuclease domain-containing protein, partial [Streptococcus cuniculi]
NVKRVLTGKDPVTGDKANRLLALGGLALDLATYAFPIAKLGKGGKVGKLAIATKTIDTVDDVSDATRAYSASKGLKAADAIDDVGDSVKGLSGSKALSDLPDNVQDAYKGYSSNNWKGTYKGQTTGTKAGGQFKNDKNYLPNFDNSGNKITYKEYDINSKIAGDSRDAERFVRGSDGSVYYTD